MKRIYRLVLPALLLLLLAQPLNTAEPKKAKRVLVLYSEDAAHPALRLTGAYFEAIQHETFAVEFVRIKWVLMM
jgi:hypothetical protein